MPSQDTEGFLTLDSFRLISVASLGSNWVAIEAKFYEEFKFLGFMRYFSARFQQSSKTYLKMAFLGSISDIYKDCGNLAEK